MLWNYTQTRVKTGAQSTMKSVFPGDKEKGPSHRRNTTDALFGRKSLIPMLPKEWPPSCPPKVTIPWSCCELQFRPRCPLLLYHSQPHKHGGLGSFATECPKATSPGLCQVNVKNHLVSALPTGCSIQAAHVGTNKSKLLPLCSHLQYSPSGREKSITPIPTLVWGKTGVVGALITVRGATGQPFIGGHK